MENPIFGPKFLYSLQRPNKQQIRNQKKMCPTKFRARAPSNFIVVKYSKCSRAGFQLVFPIPAIPKPVFRYSGLFNTGKYRQNFAGITGIRTYKMDTFDQNYYILKNILSNVHLIYFVFTLANRLLL
jgi:hypothetical protein